jgi:uncharacterized coiled-coil protein SlyX
MTIEEELISLREQLAQRDELIQRQQALLWKHNVLIEQLREQHSSLVQQVQSLQERLSKDSHNSHLPPSSDRFVRKPKSLRKKSEKPSGGQPGHPGASLQWSSTPDEVVEQHVVACEACQHDLRAVAACHVERRQVVDVPAPRLIIREYRAEQKQLCWLLMISAEHIARFPHQLLVRSRLICPLSEAWGVGTCRPRHKIGDSDTNLSPLSRKIIIPGLLGENTTTRMNPEVSRASLKQSNLDH